MRTRVVLAVPLLLCGLAGCAGRLPPKPGLYDVRQERIALSDRSLDLTYVTPVKPRSPVELILFATGDAGWRGVSGEILERLAERGAYVGAYDSRQLLARTKQKGQLESIADAAAAVDAIFTKTRRDLGLPETTPAIVTGYSRGANLVVFAAGVSSLQHHLRGAVAIALTRETDFLQAPDASQRSSSLQVDARGRIQTYPAIARAGSIPFAVIQSKHDKYVSAEESRRLFGPDTPVRRLYEVDARNHEFGGGEEELRQDLDDALGWIEGTPTASVR